jgi:hypothetical protein
VTLNFIAIALFNELADCAHQLSYSGKSVGPRARLLKSWLKSRRDGHTRPGIDEYRRMHVARLKSEVTVPA